MIRGLAFYKLENFSVSMGPTVRAWGQSMFRAGMAAQGAMAHEDSMQPSLRCVPISDAKYPKLLDVSGLTTSCHSDIMNIINYSLIGLPKMQQ